MFKGFKQFLLQGNVLDMAIGIAIGVAFTTLVDAFGKNLIDPIVAVFGGSDADGFTWRILSGNKETIIDFGGIINAVIVFIITMAVLYFVIVAPLNKVREKRGMLEEEEDTEDVVLLREIRDSLRDRS